MNHSQLGRDIGINPQTAKRWLHMIKETFLWIEVPAYSGNAVKRISSMPKGYITDTGLLCQSLFISGPQAAASHPAWGHIVETLAVMEIIKISQQLPIPPNMYHWRSHSGAEVDLILEIDGTLYPIEVKSTAHPTKKDTRGLQAFRDTYPHQQIGTGMVVHLGDANFYLSDIDIAIAYTSL